MNKIKLHTGLASIMLLASIFAGWQTLLLVTLFMFMFCEVEEKVKDVAVKVITFYVGYTIVSMGWDIIVSGVNLAINGIESLVRAINAYLDITDQISTAKLVYLITAIKVIADGVVSIMFTIVRIGFIISVLTGKPAKKNSLSAKIDEYVNKALNYVSGNLSVNINVSNPQPVTPSAQNMQPVAPQQQMSQASPVSPVQTAPVVSNVQPTVSQNTNNGNQQ